VFDRGEEFVVLEETAQTAPVMRQSVVAFVDGAHHNSDQLPVDLAKSRRPAHRRLVQHLVGDEGAGVQRVDRHDVIDIAALRVGDAVAHLVQFTVPVFGVDGLDPAHKADLTYDKQARIQVVKRIAVVGSSGSGKSTVARGISIALGIPHLELDSVFHLPGWTQLPTNEFQDAVRTFTDGDAWVVDGNYTGQGIADIVWPRVDTVVWLDLPRSQTMRRVGARTLRRVSRGEKLWNGNQERWTNIVDPRPEENILLWTWTRYNKVKEQYTRRFDDPQWEHVNRVRLTSSGEVDAFLQAVVRSP